MSVGALLIIKQLSYPILSYPILSYGKAPSKRDTFFSVQVYERAVISKVEAYERVWEICHCERTYTKADRRSLWLQKE